MCVDFPGMVLHCSDLWKVKAIAQAANSLSFWW